MFSICGKQLDCFENRVHIFILALLYKSNTSLLIAGSFNGSSLMGQAKLTYLIMMTPKFEEVNGTKGHEKADIAFMLHLLPLRPLALVLANPFGKMDRLNLNETFTLIRLNFVRSG
jgi:hypothetical protein